MIYWEILWLKITKILNIVAVNRSIYSFQIITQNHRLMVLVRMNLPKFFKDFIRRLSSILINILCWYISRISKNPMYYINRFALYELKDQQSCGHLNSLFVIGHNILGLRGLHLLIIWYGAILICFIINKGRQWFIKIVNVRGGQVIACLALQADRYFHLNTVFIVLLNCIIHAIPSWR